MLMLKNFLSSINDIDTKKAPTTPISPRQPCLRSQTFKMVVGSGTFRISSKKKKEKQYLKTEPDRESSEEITMFSQ